MRINLSFGNTPLEYSAFLSREYPAKIFIKKEFFNPGGSSKDRVAFFILKHGIDSGLIHSNTEIVEASSGNTAIGIALLCRQLGLKCKVFVSNKASMEKIKILQSLQAVINNSGHSGGPDDPCSSLSLAKSYCIRNPNTFYCNQYFNSLNTESHFQTTGPEIWENTKGTVTHFICGVGTGGTISGVGKFLKMKNPDVKIIGVEPVGSILKDYLSGNSAGTKIYKSSLIEGIGRNFIPGNFHSEFIDHIIQVKEKDCILAAYRYANHCSDLIGFSSAAVLAALYRINKKLEVGQNVVLLFADSGDRYLSKLYSKNWLVQNGFHSLVSDFKSSQFRVEKNISAWEKL
jgi:cystathionine beta-synthase